MKFYGRIILMGFLYIPLRAVYKDSHNLELLIHQFDSIDIHPVHERVLPKIGQEIKNEYIKKIPLEKTVIAHESSEIRTLILSPDGNIIAVGLSSRDILLYDLKTGQQILMDNIGFPLSITFSADSTKLIGGFFDGSIKIWDIEHNVLENTLKAARGTILSLQCSPDGKRLVTRGFDGTVTLWDLETSAIITTLTGHSSPIAAVRFTPDSQKMIASLMNGTLMVWSAQNGNLLNSFDAHVKSPHLLQSDHSNKVITSSNNVVNIWDLASGNIIHTLQNHTDIVSAIQLSPLENRIVTGSMDGVITLWDAKTGNVIHTSHEHKKPVLLIQFNRDGDKYITRSEDGIVHIWDVETGDKLATLYKISAVGMGLEDNVIFTGSSKGSLVFWDLEPWQEFEDLFNQMNIGQYLLVKAIYEKKRIGKKFGINKSDTRVWKAWKSLDDVVKDLLYDSVKIGK